MVGENRGNSYISPEVWNLLKNSDACFKGPTTTIPTPNAPRSVAVSIRQKFELYANVRPIYIQAFLAQVKFYMR